MPQPRKHDSHAARQAAYRKRQAQALSSCHAPGKPLPPGPTVPTIPGWARWRRAMADIEKQMKTIESEMQSYYDQRSERWQDSERAEEFQERLDDLSSALELVTDWIA